MALFKNWKPKTVAGKILKGTTIGVLGAGAIASGVGAVAGAVGGAGLFAGAASGVGTLIKAGAKVGSGTKTVLSKLSAGAVKLVTGQSKEQREVIQSVKKEARASKEKQEFIDKLMKAGLSKTEAYAKAGVAMVSGGDEKTESGIGFISKMRAEADDALTVDESGAVVKKKDDKMLIYGGLGLLGLFVLPKILKMR